ncbi:MULTISPECIES: FAD-binding oxidoreductase [Actinomadura]|uniref:FAD-binding oxidoreductase n=1 Tax=Actinomadura TaxID=1988 RepID=UPI0003AD70E8|nr:Mitomycin radical oxidase [Actinomadura madurae]
MISKLHDLRTVVRGRVLLPGDDGFDQARRPWNLAVDQAVPAVVEAADAADVAAVVRFARDRGTAVSVQPNGHGATTNLDGAVLLRTHRLDSLQIDPVARRARVGAGVSSGGLQAAVAPHGLTGLPGSSPVVSVTGVALGGGLSWFGRTHGWVADSVTAFDIVDAEGRQRRITADTDPDLFWAMRGGGGSFAIVTALELTLHRAPHLYGGRMLWPIDHAPDVMDAYRRLTATAPDDLTLWLDLLHFPGSDPMIAVDAAFLGQAAAACDLLSPLDRLPRPVADSRRPMTVAELGTITAEPTDPGAGSSRAELLTGLDDTAAEILLADPIAPLLNVQIRHLGGAFTHPSDSPHGPLTEPYALYMFGVPADSPTAEAITAKQRSLADALQLSGRKPFTFLSPGETPADAFTPAALHRLRDLERRHNPHNTFRANFPISG